MIRDILSLIILSLFISLPLGMYKYSLDPKVQYTYIQLEDLKSNKYGVLVDIWGSPIILKVHQGKVVYISTGPDKKINTNDDIKVSE